MPNPRSADDFDTIRTRLEQLKKEREEILKSNPEQPTLPLEQHSDEYYGCAVGTTVTDRMQLQLSEAPIGYILPKLTPGMTVNVCTGEEIIKYEDEDLIIVTDEENSQWVRRIKNSPVARVLPGL